MNFNETGQLYGWRELNERKLMREHDHDILSFKI